MALPGTDARAGFKDDAEFDFRYRGTLPSGSSWSSRSFYSVGARTLPGGDILATSFRRTARSYRRPRSPPTEIRGDELHREAREGVSCLKPTDLTGDRGFESTSLQQ